MIMTPAPMTLVSNLSAASLLLNTVMMEMFALLTIVKEVSVKPDQETLVTTQVCVQLTLVITSKVAFIPKLFVMIIWCVLPTLVMQLPDVNTIKYHPATSAKMLHHVLLPICVTLWNAIPQLEVALIEEWIVTTTTHALLIHV